MLARGGSAFSLMTWPGCGACGRRRLPSDRPARASIDGVVAPTTRLAPHRCGPAGTDCREPAQHAAKYAKQGGHIWLSVEQEGNDCVLRLRDTGIGIAPELLPRVFDLFTQAERSLARSQGGLGIGLALVKRLVVMHGGRVDVHSTLGQGSEFVVSLPVALSSAAPLPVALPDQHVGHMIPVSSRTLGCVESQKRVVGRIESM